MSNSKINKLQNLLIKKDVDALAIVPGSNFLYLTGGNFHLMERPTILIISKDKKPIAILPVLEIDSFKKLKLDTDIFEWQDSDGYQDAFNKAKLDKRFRKVANDYIKNLDLYTKECNN